MGQQLLLKRSKPQEEGARTTNMLGLKYWVQFFPDQRHSVTEDGPVEGHQDDYRVGKLGKVERIGVQPREEKD